MFYTCQSKSIVKTWLLLAVFFVFSFLVFSQNVFAQNEEIIVDTRNYEEQDFEDTIYADDFSELIDSFRSDITVHPDGTIDVVETIQYDFKDLEKHGIYRDIPLIKIVGSDRPLKINNISVTDENGVQYTTSVTTGNPLNIRIGDADKTVSGKHIYKISYTGTNAIGYFDDRDEIYWNATGNEWLVPIWDAEAHVYIPGEFTKEQLYIASYCGQFGAEDSCVDGEVVFDPIKNQTEVAFFTDPDVYYDPGGGMTVAVGFPKGVVAQPVLEWWEKDSTYYALAALFAGVSFVIFLSWLFVWYFPERRKRNRAIVAEFTPPDNLSPSQISMIYNHMTPMGKAVSVDILYLASLGYISITQEDKNRTSMFRIGGKEVSPKMHKFAKFMTVLLPALILFFIVWAIFAQYGLILAVIVAIIKRNDLKNRIDVVFHPKEFILTPTKKLASESTLPSHVWNLYNLITNDGAKAKSLSELESERNYYIFQSIQASAQDSLNTMYPDVKKYAETVRFFPELFSKIIIPLFVIGFASVFFAGLKGIFSPEVPATIFVSIGSLVGSIFLYVVIGKILRALLFRKTEIWYKVAGLRRYIRIAEKERLIFANDPAKSLEIYSTLFPYAMAFGLEKKWTKIFSGILIASPDWYHGSSTTSLSSFSSSVAGFSFAAASTSLAGQPASSSSGGSGSSGSSSGSSGGGSSGGGGGGGGGGSW